MGWTIIKTREPLRETIKAEFGEAYGYMHLAHAPRGECYVLARLAGSTGYGLFAVRYEHRTGATSLKVMCESEHPFMYNAPPAMLNSADPVGDLYEDGFPADSAREWRMFCMLNAADRPNTDPL